MNTSPVAPVKAAKLLAVSRQHVLRLINSGELAAESFEVGDRTFHRVPLESIREYQRKREQKILSAPINDLPEHAGTVSTSPADGATPPLARETAEQERAALADNTSGGQ